MFGYNDGFAKRIVVEAQAYVASLYEKAGFKKFGDEFLENDIPHVKMSMDLV